MQNINNGTGINFLNAQSSTSDFAKNAELHFHDNASSYYTRNSNNESSESIFCTSSANICNYAKSSSAVFLNCAEASSYCSSLTAPNNSYNRSEFSHSFGFYAALENVSSSNNSKSCNSSNAFESSDSSSNLQQTNFQSSECSRENLPCRNSSNYKHSLPASNSLCLQLKQWLYAKFAEGDYKLAKILDYRTKDGRDASMVRYPSDYIYYVHFHKLNRRMDMWISFNDLIPIDASGKPLFDVKSFNNVTHLKNNDPLDSSTSNRSKTPNNNARELSMQNVKNENLFAINTNPQEFQQEESLQFERLKLFDPTIYFSDNDEDPDEHEGMDRAAILAHEEATKVKNINKVKFGIYTLETWYYSPFPLDYQNVDILYICEFCLSFFKFECEINRHMKRCSVKHPPGDEIYRDNNLSVFEVDGQLARVYSENLCYMAKLFLDHKTLQYDVEPFLFYILTEVDLYGCHLVGYFSKEKVSLQGYNVACILILPQYQRKGYGKFLISFSYHLSLIEGRFGAPEKPLSDLGRRSYRCWWTDRLLKLLKNIHGKVSLEDLVKKTAIRRDDIQRTLEEIGILRYVQGQHLLVLQPEFVERCLKHTGHAGIDVKRKKLHFVPFNRQKTEFDIT